MSEHSEYENYTQDMSEFIDLPHAELDIKSSEVKRVAVEAASILTDEEDPEVTYYDIINRVVSKSDLEDVKRGVVDKTISKDLSVLSDLANQTASDINLSVPEAALTVKQYEQASIERQEDSLENNSFEKAFANTHVDTRMQSPDLGVRLAEQEAWLNYANGSIADLAEEVGAWDYVKSIGGFMIPDSTWDLSQFTDSSIFTSLGDFEEWHNNFSALSPREKVAQWPEIVEKVKESHDNDLDALTFLSNILSINPVTETRINAGFDFLDIGGPFIAIKTVKALAKVKSLPKKLKDLDDVDGAANVTGRAIQDETGEVAEAVGMDAIEQAATVSPFKLADVIPGSVDDISNEVVEFLEIGATSMTHELSKIKQLINSWRDGSFMQREFLSKASREKAIESTFAKALKAQEELGEEALQRYGLSYDNIRRGKVTNEGVEILYDVGETTLSRKTFFTLDDETGLFRDIEMNPIKAYLFSPERMFASNDWIVAAATRFQDQTARIQNQFNRAFDAAIKPIKGNKKSMAKVDEVLRRGDEWTIKDGRVFTPDELVDGMADGLTIPKLTLKEQSAYYNMNKLNSELHDFVNFTVYRKLQINGYKTTTVNGQWDDGIYAKDFNAKPIHDKTKGSSIVKEGDSVKVYDESMNGGEGGVRGMTKAQVEKSYDNGLMISKLERPEKMADEGVEYLLHKPDNVSDLNLNQLNKRTGYLSKETKDTHYFAYTVSPDGVRSVVRSFDNATDADLYKTAMQKTVEDKAGNTVPDPKQDRYFVKRNRDLAQTEREETLANAFGGPRTGARSSREILHGLDPTARIRLDAYESISRNIKAISNVMPVNDYREAMKRMWLNTVKNMAKVEGIQILKDPTDFMSEIVGLSKLDKRRVGLEELRKYMSDQLKIPTRDERMFDAMVRHSAEYLEKTFFDKDFRFPGIKTPLNPRKSLMNMQDTDPFGLVRSATFHPLLGFFNVSQLLVQAQGATIAMALDPLATPKRMAQYLYIRSIADLKNGDIYAQGKARAAFAKAAGLSKEEGDEIADQLIRSGLFDGINQGADLGTALQSGHSSLGALKRIADKGLIFYKEGEMVTRGYAFLQARDAWKLKNVGKKLDDNALGKIIDETYKLTMNLSRANRAAYQKGALGVTTQFTPVLFRFMENLTGSKWTTGQKVAVLSSQLAIFGAAGTPGMTPVVNGLAKLGGIDENDIPEKLKLLLNKGTQGIMADILGIDNDLASRMAFLGNQETFLSKMFDGETPVTEVAFGAFGSILDRSEKTMKILVPIVGNTLSNPSSISTNDLTTALSSIAEITSTWSNAKKAAAIYSTQSIMTNKGILLKDNSGINLQTALFKGLGFGLEIEQEYYKKGDAIRVVKERRQSAVDMIVKLRYSYLANIGTTDPDTAAKNFRSARLIIYYMNGFGEETENTRLIDKAVNQRLVNSKSAIDKKAQEFFNEAWRAQDDIQQVIQPLQGLE